MKPSFNLRLPDCLALLAVIALALMIVFPAATTARSGGKSALCLTNLHLLGRAWTPYPEDNDGYLAQGIVTQIGSTAMGYPMWCEDGIAHGWSTPATATGTTPTMTAPWKKN